MTNPEQTLRERLAWKPRKQRYQNGTVYWIVARGSEVQTTDGWTECRYEMKSAAQWWADKLNAEESLGDTP